MERTQVCVCFLSWNAKQVGINLVAIKHAGLSHLLPPLSSWQARIHCFCRDPIVITVAATDTDDQRLWLSPTVASNVGSCVDIWAPGANILSASIRSDTASDYRSGTSQAAPVVAGGIVLYLQNRTGAHVFALKIHQRDTVVKAETLIVGSCLDQGVFWGLGLPHHCPVARALRHNRATLQTPHQATSWRL